ncbi:hypothetical protein [Novosphingobium sp. AP12]|uniref:hypothetical protein n=1 Tax=Novosphingobium sp. AP12 TaxID=1144305 RepID=UPI0002720AD9|nr:hypothetical protein [Novosphingobium sp. AP12]EJL25617.1 hypothetical protein PMI02_03180 [Novosphingobium sp. AP12]
MSQSETSERASAISDTLAAIVLSIAALLTSWASFQAALWDGEQAASYTQAGATRVKASLLATENGQQQGLDMFMFTQWLNAYAAEDRPLQDFYHERFRPEFRQAFDDWLALRPMHNVEAPHSPFLMPEYSPRLAREASALDKRADAQFEEGQRYNSTSDAYVAATVVFALSLFLGGIGQTFDRKRLAAALTLIGAAACVFGLVRLTALPTMSL